MVMAYVVRQHADALASAEVVTEDEDDEEVGVRGGGGGHAALRWVLVQRENGAQGGSMLRYAGCWCRGRMVLFLTKYWRSLGALGRERWGGWSPHALAAGCGGRVCLHAEMERRAARHGGGGGSKWCTVHGKPEGEADPAGARCLLGLLAAGATGEQGAERNPPPPTRPCRVTGTQAAASWVGSWRRALGGGAWPA